VCNAVNIAMPKFDPLRTREPYPVDDAGVIVFIGENQVMPFDERREDADVGSVARTEVERGFGALEFRESLLHSGKRFAVSSKQSGSRGSAAVNHNGLCHPLFYERMRCEAEIVVG
jgi:hypothetical protein